MAKLLAGGVILAAIFYGYTEFWNPNSGLRIKSSSGIVQGIGGNASGLIDSAAGVFD